MVPPPFEAHLGTSSDSRWSIGQRDEAYGASESAGASRARLLEAAGVVVARVGVRDASVRAIGEQAGMSRGAVGYHFGSTEGLALALVELAAENAAAAVPGSERAGGLGPVELFDAYCDPWLRDPVRLRLATMLAHHGIVAGGVAREAARRERARALAHVAGVITTRQSRGDLPGTLDPHSTAGFLLSAVLGLVLQRLADPELDLAPGYAELRLVVGARLLG